MRSVRALDVLFTAQSAVNLLSRVVASQTGNLCRVEPQTYTHTQDTTRTSEPLLQEDTKSALNLDLVSKEASTLHVGVRQRYTKPSSKLFESLEPNSLQQSPPVRTLDLSRTCFSPSILQTQMIMRASKVPSSRVGRLFHYGGMFFTNYLVLI
jgi:hypothetical protein